MIGVLANDYTASVDCVIWSPNGAIFWYVTLRRFIYNWERDLKSIVCVKQIVLENFSRLLKTTQNTLDKK